MFLLGTETENFPGNEAFQILHDIYLLCRYKAWGSFLGMQLAERDIIVACLDYRYAVVTPACLDIVWGSFIACFVNNDGY